MLVCLESIQNVARYESNVQEYAVIIRPKHYIWFRVT